MANATGATAHGVNPDGLRRGETHLCQCAIVGASRVLATGPNSPLLWDHPEQDLPVVDARDAQQAQVRPGIVRQPAPNLRFVSGSDDQQRRLFCAEWPAEHDKTIIDERLHEARMLIPLLLLAHGKRIIPVLAVIAQYREIRR